MAKREIALTVAALLLGFVTVYAAVTTQTNAGELRTLSSDVSDIQYQIEEVRRR